MGGRASARLALLAFIEARLDRYGGGEALSVCPPLCDYKFDAPQEQKRELEYEVEHGRGLRDPFSGHSDCVLSHKYQQATDGIVSPGDHPTASEDRHFGDDSRARSP